MKIGKVKSKYISSSLRLNSDFHLSEGIVYDRLFKTKEYKLLGELTKDIYCAGRSKRIYVSKEYGFPYLGNTDIMSSSPLEGCNYASKKFWKEKKGFLKNGMILTGRVGQNTVGAYSFANIDLEGTLGSDNVIRIINNGKVKNGFLYAFLASKYGYYLSRRHISGNAQPFITEDMLSRLPIPIFPESKQQEIHNLIIEASELRVEANRLLRKAVEYFENIVGESETHLNFQTGKISSVSLKAFHKRLDSQYQLLWKDLFKEQRKNLHYEKIWSFAKNIYVGGRSKRIYVEKGIPFLSSSDMMLYNPKRSCKKVSKNTPNLSSMLVSKKDILISRSGTVGNSILVGEELNGTAISEHALRLVIDPNKISPNYVFCFLKTKYGMKSMEASSFGSVIITLNEDLIGNINIPVLSIEQQNEINLKIEQYLRDMDQSVIKENIAIDLIEKEIESWQEY
jgi:type I restriction enzyme, S subunit